MKKLVDSKSYKQQGFTIILLVPQKAFQQHTLPNPLKKSYRATYITPCGYVLACGPILSLVSFSVSFVFGNGYAR